MARKYTEFKKPDFPEFEKEILQFWKEQKVFERSVTEKEGKPSFTFYEGPPSANGTPGIHHVMARTVKDLFCRYKTLKGYQVKRKGGWDTHGLPVELQVEKELGITKEDIGKKISVEDYNRKCREAVMKFKGQWEDLTEKMGYWVDMDDPYVTFEKDYIESLWSLLKKLFDKGLLYKGYTIQPYSPKAGTGLSSHELNQPGTYRLVKDTSIVAQFKVKRNEKSEHLFDNPDEEVFLIAWTTTPWTLPSNCALAVGKNIQYVKIRTFNPYTFRPESVVLAKDLVGKYFSPKAKDMAMEDYHPGDKQIPWEIMDSYSGADLAEIRYEQLMPYVTNEELEKHAFRVIIGDFVTTEEGTGIVHTASVFGADDYRVAQQNNVPAVLVKNENGEEMPLVDKQGRFVDEVTDFAGRFVKQEYEDDETVNDPEYKSTDVLIAIKLKEENKAFRVEKYEHSYPHCWRTDKPVLYYPLDSWFIKTTAFKDRLVELNNTINWKPAATGKGRFGNWLENLVDWNLSRSRFWGTPLPIWRSEDKNESICIGSLEELRAEAAKAKEAGLIDFDIADDFDLHRPYVDNIVLLSPGGQKMYREPDLIDVWFDSGAMPYAQWHYPFENEEVFKANYPADFIAEGVDQTRGWFFTLHAIAVMLFDSVAFKNVIANGLVLDKDGNKMSKRFGNAIDPFEAIETYGADCNRWYMISNAPPWDNLKFDFEGVKEVQRRFFGTLHNTYNFFALYANIDGFNFSSEAVPFNKLPESDRWVLSRLHSLIQNVSEAYEDYEPTRAARLIQDFTIDDLSNWYVRLNRKRFWVGEFTDDKRAAYETLYTCLETILKLSAPVIPFISEHYFRHLNAVTEKDAQDSIHLSDFPEANELVIDRDLEERINYAQKISSLVHSLRKKEKVKVRQPLQKIMIPVLDKKAKEQISSVIDMIRNEVNVKEVELLLDDHSVITKTAKANFRELGKRFGPKLKSIVPHIQNMDQEGISEYEQYGVFTIDIDGEHIQLEAGDIIIETHDVPGWSVASENGLTVALDINLTDELKKEGLARDIVNRIQNLRKDRGLEVQDKISVKIGSGNAFVEGSVRNYSEYISRETQALELNIVENPGELAETIDIDGIEVDLIIEKVSGGN